MGGCLVSANVAPTTATVSVTQNRTIALSFRGVKYFPPMEIFEQGTTNTLMTAVLLNDLADPTSVANPNVRLGHPIELHARNACHGGAQRMAYTLGSIGETSLLAYGLTHPHKMT